MEVAEWSDLLNYLGPAELAEVDDLLNCPDAQAELAEWRKAELERCAADIVYWIQNYAVTFDPRLPYPFIPFKLYDFQIELLEWLAERERNGEDGLIEKSRDSGVSYLCADYALHGVLFRSGFSAGLGSFTQDKVDKIGDPDSLFEKIRITLRHLPPWMQPAGFNERLHNAFCKLINPANGSTITGEVGDNIGRGGRKTIYIVDEAAHLEHQKLVDTSLSHTTNCRIYVSTPHGLDEFYKKRKRMPVFRAHWKSDPRKNHFQILLAGRVVDTGHGAPSEVPRGASVIYPWHELQLKKDTPEIVAQEVDIDYIGTGAPRFDREFLMGLLERLTTDPRLAPELVEEPGKSAWTGTVSTYVQPEDDHDYLIVADVAEGLDGEGNHDYSVAHIYDLETWEQVAHYRGRPDTHNYGIDLATLGQMYNWALVAVERTGPGLSTLNTLENTSAYPSIYQHRDFDEVGNPKETMRPGYPATKRSKLESEDDLASIIRDMADEGEGFLWREANTVEEMIHFVRLPGGKSGAEVGSHDDEVTCCKIAAQLMPMFSTRRKMRVEQADEFGGGYGARRR